jgi:uncharacterized small protein (DUF1192 family)
MPKKRPEELQQGVKSWGFTDPIETRIRRLTDEVRALRNELTVKKNRLSAANDTRLPSRPDAQADIPRARSRKRR